MSVRINYNNFKYIYCEPPVAGQVSGNVMATVNDRKVYDGSNFVARVMSAQTYYPGGSIEAGRMMNSSAYRFGQNTQEADMEISGTWGTHYTAEFWEYDARILRRWNVDPVMKPWESPYLCFSGNPIWYSDPAGDNADNPDDPDNPNSNSVPSTDLSKLNLKDKAKVINIMVMGSGEINKKSNNAYPVKEWSKDEQNDENTVALFAKDAKELDNMLGELRTTYGKEIGNIVFSSHGGGEEASFYIGETRISKGEDLGFLKDDISPNSIIFIGACHTGSPKIGGDILIKGISQNLGVTVIANQSWENGYGRPDGQLYTDNSTHESTKNYKWALAHAGSFTVAAFSSTGVVLFEVHDVRFTKSGEIYLNEPKFYELSRPPGEIKTKPKIAHPKKVMKNSGKTVMKALKKNIKQN